MSETIGEAITAGLCDVDGCTTPARQLVVGESLTFCDLHAKDTPLTTVEVDE